MDMKLVMKKFINYHNCAYTHKRSALKPNVHNNIHTDKFDQYLLVP